jgi:hypothetical protein
MAGSVFRWPALGDVHRRSWRTKVVAALSNVEFASGVMVQYREDH